VQVGYEGIDEIVGAWPSVEGAAAKVREQRKAYDALKPLNDEIKAIWNRGISGSAKTSAINHLMKTHGREVFVAACDLPQRGLDAWCVQAVGNDGAWCVCKEAGVEPTEASFY
jgi:hypothetical protein